MVKELNLFKDLSRKNVEYLLSDVRICKLHKICDGDKTNSIVVKYNRRKNIIISVDYNSSKNIHLHSINESFEEYLIKEYILLYLNKKIDVPTLESNIFILLFSLENSFGLNNIIKEQDIIVYNLIYAYCKKYNEALSIVNNKIYKCYNVNLVNDFIKSNFDISAVSFDYDIIRNNDFVQWFKNEKELDIYCIKFDNDINIYYLSSNLIFEDYIYSKLTCDGISNFIEVKKVLNNDEIIFTDLDIYKTYIDDYIDVICRHSLFSHYNMLRNFYNMYSNRKHIVINNKDYYIYKDDSGTFALYKNELFLSLFDNEVELNKYFYQYKNIIYKLYLVRIDFNDGDCFEILLFDNNFDKNYYKELLKDTYFISEIKIQDGLNDKNFKAYYADLKYELSEKIKKQYTDTRVGELISIAMKNYDEMQDLGCYFLD